MVKAYVLVECFPGKVAFATQALRKLEGVSQAESVLGPWDVILYVEKPDLDNLGDFVTKKVQQVPGVKGSITCLSV